MADFHSLMARNACQKSMVVVMGRGDASANLLKGGEGERTGRGGEGRGGKGKGGKEG